MTTARKVMVRSVGPAGLERIELKRLTERVEWLFALLQEAVAVQTPAVAGTWAPQVDVCETTRAIDVRIELPGVNASQVKIGLHGNKLRVYGEKKKKSPRQTILSHHCSERSYGRFDRVIPLRWTIDIKSAAAELSNGVLVVHLPKLKDRRGSELRIPIVQKD
jgi:HSP20 family protein